MRSPHPPHATTSTSLGHKSSQTKQQLRSPTASLSVVFVGTDRAPKHSKDKHEAERRRAGRELARSGERAGRGGGGLSLPQSLRELEEEGAGITLHCVHYQRNVNVGVASCPPCPPCPALPCGRRVRVRVREHWMEHGTGRTPAMYWTFN